MLSCGREWQPRLVKRVIESYETSTRVAKVDTDAGTGFLKGMGNPAGSAALTTELVAGELGVWMGLKLPPFAIVEIHDLEVPMVGRGSMQFGPAFISKELPGATSDGGDVFLKRINNPDDVAKIVVFDTWIRNSDRCPPDPDQTPYNRDNLFFTPNGKKFDLVALDHSHCLIEGTLEELRGPEVVEDEAVYGNYPEFRPFIQAESVAAAAARLRQIDRRMVNEIVNSIPADWGVSRSEKAALVDLICERALKVADYLPAKLVEQPCLEL